MPFSPRLDPLPMPIASLDEIRASVGQPIGSSDWIEVTQDRIDVFAETTEDRQFIHIDPAAAAQTPVGGTIAHGFLSVSLLSRMAADAMQVPDTTKMAVNYGLDRVRFIAPVRAGKRVRGHFTLMSLNSENHVFQPTAQRVAGVDLQRQVTFQDVLIAPHA